MLPRGEGRRGREDQGLGKLAPADLDGLVRQAPRYKSECLQEEPWGASFFLKEVSRFGHPRGETALIRVENLSKRFGDIRAVDGISFEVRKGEVYGLLGPNGAGKTTTLSMLAGLLRPDEGRVLFEGTDLAADPIGVKSHLGVVPQETALYPELTARENLRFWAGLYGLTGETRDRAVKTALEQVGLTARANEPIKRYSGGMK